MMFSSLTLATECRAFMQCLRKTYIRNPTLNPPTMRTYFMQFDTPSATRYN